MPNYTILKLMDRFNVLDQVHGGESREFVYKSAIISNWSIKFRIEKLAIN